jgi:hypothetical protein
LVQTSGFTAESGGVIADYFMIWTTPADVLCRRYASCLFQQSVVTVNVKTTYHFELSVTDDGIIHQKLPISKLLMLE